MTPKFILQVLGLVVIGTVGIAAAADGIRVDTAVIIVGGILALAAPHVLMEVLEWYRR